MRQVIVNLVFYLMGGATGVMLTAIIISGRK